jgi:hypothetical protein
VSDLHIDVRASRIWSSSAFVAFRRHRLSKLARGFSWMQICRRSGRILIALPLWGKTGRIVGRGRTLQAAMNNVFDRKIPVFRKAVPA